MSNNKLEGLGEKLDKTVNTQQPIPDPPSHSSVESHHDVRVPLEPAQQPIPLPLPTLKPKPKPLSHPPPHAENKQDEKEDKNKIPEEMLMKDAAAMALRFHMGLGQYIGIMLSLCQNKEDKFKKLTAEKDMISVQLKESEQQNVVLSDLNEKIVKKSEEDIGQAKSEEAIYRAKYMELREQLTAVEKKSLEKDTLISSLREKEMALKEEKARVEALEMNKKKLEEDIAKKDKDVIKVEERFRKKCQQNVKLSKEMDDIRASANKLQSQINQYVEGNKMDKITISNLQTERDTLKMSVEKISYELEKERNDNKVKVVELEKNAREISDLKKEVSALQEEKKELPKKFGTFLAHTGNSFFEQLFSQNLHSVSPSSLPSDEKSTPEPSSMAVEMDEDNKNGNDGTATEAEQLEVQKDVAMTTTPVKTNHSGNCTAKSAGKKRRGDTNVSIDHHDYPLGFEQISQVHFNKKLKVIHDTEKPKGRTSSRNKKVLPTVAKSKQATQAGNSNVNMKK